MAILIAGCGGGYDIMGGIPLYLDLIKQKKKVYLLNLSFTTYSSIYSLKNKKNINDLCFEIDYSKNKNLEFDHFPEYYLSKELKIPIFALKYDGLITIQDLSDTYKMIIEENNIKTIYLIDGGCDVFLSGNESELGTPLEDMMHIKAISVFPELKLYVCAIGMNCDVGKDKGFDDFEKRLEFLQNNNILLSSEVWDLKNENIQRYRDIVYKCKPINSIVHSMICAALEGHTNDYIPKQLLKRINISKINLGIITKTFIILDGWKLLKTIHYIDNLKLNMNVDQIDDTIEEYCISIKKNS